MAAKYRNANLVRVDLQQKFSNLTKAEWSPRSPFDDSYQCLAWAACWTDRKWWPIDSPDYYWPSGLPLADPPQAAPVDFFIQAFASLGYEPCGDMAGFEFGYQKVAVYANDLGVTHMARQHFLGRGWLSKLGDYEDILHRNLSDVEGEMSPLANEYGEVVLILKRGWWTAARFGLFRGWWAAFKFWLYRLAHW